MESQRYTVIIWNLLCFNATPKWPNHCGPGGFPGNGRDQISTGVISMGIGNERHPLSFQFIADHIETNILIKEDYECQELIKDAFKYHSLPDRRSTLQSPRTKPRKSTVGMLYAVGGMDNNKGMPALMRLLPEFWPFSEVAPPNYGSPSSKSILY